MSDILESFHRAMVRQGWVYGDKAYRIGHPFEWIDGDKQPYLYNVQGIQAVVQFLSMFYEQYPIPDEIVTSDYDQMRVYCENQLREACKHFVPFLLTTANLEPYITTYFPLPFQQGLRMPVLRLKTSIFRHIGRSCTRLQVVHKSGRGELVHGRTLQNKHFTFSHSARGHKPLVRGSGK